jgi:hypothetical protein
MHGTPVQRELRLAMNMPERAQNMLGQRIGEAGKGPGLPALALPACLLETGLQHSLAGLAGRKLFLELDKLPSDLLTEITNTLRPIKPKIK